MPMPSDCTALELPWLTPRLHIRALEMSDLDDVYVLCSHPEICRYIRPPMSREEVRTHIEERLRPWRFEDNKWYSLAVSESGETRVIGELVFRMESLADRRAEVGYRFHPDAQGKGYAYESVALLMDNLFTVLDLHKEVAYCDDDNEASRRLLEKLGMTYVGCRKQHIWVGGKWRNLCIYEKLEVPRASNP